ncbi:unnamed protein product [Clavelina lepadiformis]|uniref:Uncharacterized protein n=1 Tax=Clavelina lepadiformis TaxID=159417 RepID=A0ABP0G9C6_CLALP
MSKKGWFGCQREIAHQCTILPLDYKSAIYWLGLMQRQKLCQPKFKCWYHFVKRWKDNSLLFLSFAFTNNALCKQGNRSIDDEITYPKKFSTIDYSRA